MDRKYYARKNEEARTYSHAVKVKGGHSVYLAGVVNRDRDGKVLNGDFQIQARTAFERLRENIESCGGKLEDIVTMTVFITDPRNGDNFVKVRSEFFKQGHYPASALITVSALAHPDYCIEIQAIAVLEN